MAQAKAQSNTKLTGVFDLFTDSKNLVMKNLKLFSILYALPFLLTVGDILGKGRIDKEDTNNWAKRFENLSSGGAFALVGFGLSLAIITAIASAIIQVMLYVAQLKVAKGKKPTLDELWTDTKHYIWRMIGLAFAVTFLFIGGLILLIVPGLIVLRRYYLAPYYLIDKDLSISEAMKLSAEQSKPVSGSIWSIIGLLVLISIIGGITVVGGFVSIILAALFSVAPALRYREIQVLSRD